MAAERALIATHSGLRGRPGEGLSAERLQATVTAFVARLEEAGAPVTLGLARDSRPSSVELAGGVAEAAVAAGADVADFGVLSTPGAKLAARRRGLDGAIVVTASHLGTDWNGIKLVAAPSYAPVDIRSLPDASRARRRPRRGAIGQEPGAAREHVEAVCASVDREAIARAGLRVALEGGAGAAPRMAIEALGCEVCTHQADVGLRLDPDGDRLRLADSGGRLLDQEVAFPLVANARAATTIVKGADTSAMVDLIARARGGWVRTVQPGELHLVRELIASGADLAGEGNGGVVVPEVGAARDALAAGAAILELVASSGAPLVEHADALPRFARRRSTLPCSGRDAAARSLAAAAERLGALSGDPESGFRVERERGTWALARQSATEPVIRLTVEADAEDEAEELHSELRAALAV